MRYNQAMNLYALARLLPPEAAHRMGVRVLATGLVPDYSKRLSNEAAVEVAGIQFPNPVGLAAGFDKNAEIPHQAHRLGFGFVEVGTITPHPQSGNPKPRVFRLPQDRAVINRLGFNNAGADAARRRIEHYREQDLLRIPLGVNIGANKDSVDRLADYAFGAEIFAPLADYLTVNISSPNTEGLRDLQQTEVFERLIDAVFESRERSGAHPPVFFKFSPDLSGGELAGLAELAVTRQLDGLILTNTTISRPESLVSSHQSQTGGLSGEPLKSLAEQTLQKFSKFTEGKVPLIGVGGIATGADARGRLQAGASLVQLYTSLVYGGLSLPARIVRELSTSPQ